MKRLIDYFRGCRRLRIEGCEPERCLDRLARNHITFWDIRKLDEFTVLLTVYRADAPEAEELCKLLQCDVTVTALRSFRGDFYGLGRRWALLLGMVGVIAAMIVLPQYVIALDVEGCRTVEPSQVLRVLEEEGVGFGTWGQSIDNEQLRNRVLQRIPELRWMAVNRSGLRATVLVAERDEVPPMLDRRDRVTSLVACADGVVTQVRALNGQALCRPGDAVVKGQVLISGLMDVERIVVPTRALGEVYADTRRPFSVLTPVDRVRITPRGVKGRCFYLCVGRKRIKICGSSGIFIEDCVKMIRREALQLPGGYPVPISLCIETYYRADEAPASLSEDAAAELLHAAVLRRMARELVAGTINDSRTTLASADGCYTLTETLYCREMIARSTEIPILELEQHGTNDQRGTNGTAD